MLGDPLLAIVTALDLCADKNNVGPAGARVLAKATHLTQLRELRLRNNEIFEAGGRDLARAMHFSGLTKLDLAKLSESAPTACARWQRRRTWPGCASCGSGLVLRQQQQPLRRDAGVFALAAASHLNGLVTLDLQWSEVRFLVRALAAAPQFADLREPGSAPATSACSVRRRWRSALPNLDPARSLRQRDRGQGRGGDRPAAEAPAHPRSEPQRHRHRRCESDRRRRVPGRLARAPASLQQLGDEGATELSLADQLTRLRLLDLRNSGVGPSGVEDLLEEAWLSRLECLLLDANRLGNTASEALAKATHMTWLKELRLRARLSAGRGEVSRVRAAPRRPARAPRRRQPDR